MAFVDVEYGMGGGTTLNPTLISNTVTNVNTTTTLTIDTSKKYMLYCHLCIGWDTRATWDACFYIDNGTVTAISPNSGWDMSCTASGTTLSIKNENTSYNQRNMLVQLD